MIISDGNRNVRRRQLLSWHGAIFQAVASDRHPAGRRGVESPILQFRRRRTRYRRPMVGFRGRWSAARSRRVVPRNPSPDRWRQFRLVCRFLTPFRFTLSSRYSFRLKRTISRLRDDTDSNCNAMSFVYRSRSSGASAIFIHDEDSFKQYKIMWLYQ